MSSKGTVYAAGQ